MSSNRYIKGSVYNNEIRDLLSSLFLCELISPSKIIYLCSPWISNIEIISNEGLQVSAIFNNRKKVSLIDVLDKLQSSGSSIRIITKDGEEYSRKFVEEMNLANNNVGFRYDTSLHEKGLLTDSFYVSGSMNFTYYGKSNNRESLGLDIDNQKIAEQRIYFDILWNSLGK